jgi:REP element-mobilizing transposase RayT
MSRGNRKCSIFKDDDDRHRFFETLTDAVVRYRIRIDAACQMGTHFHLAIETPDANLSQAMHFINTTYSQSFNRRHGYTGHLYEGRFRSRVVQRESYLRRACRYVVLNPVKSKLVSAPGDWRWSSYRATAGLEEPPLWLNTDWIVPAFDAVTRAEAQERYRAFVNSPLASRMRLSGNSLVFGSKTFKKAVIDETALKLRDRDLPIAQRALARPELGELFGDATREISKRDKAIHQAHVVHGYFLSEIATILRLDRSTVSRAFQREHNRSRPA